MDLQQCQDSVIGSKRCLDAVLTINEVNDFDYSIADMVNCFNPDNDLTLDCTTYCFIFYFANRLPLIFDVTLLLFHLHAPCHQPG